MVYTFIRNFLNKKLHPSCRIITVERDLKYIKLPFYGSISLSVRSRLRRLLQQCYPQVDFRYIFVNTNTIGSYFKFKDKVPTPLCSNVVYMYNCSSCNAGYVGSSIRNFKIRILEHRGLSFRTGLPLSKPAFSEIRNHCYEFDHFLLESDFKILDTCMNDKSDLRVMESLYIKERRPLLNSNLSAVQLYTV